MSYFHPQRMPVLPARRREAARRQLEQVVEQSAIPARRSAGQRRRTNLRFSPRFIGTVVATVVLSTGGAAFALAEHHSSTNFTQVRCYTVADPAGGYYATVVMPTSSAQESVAYALSFCAFLYRQGFLHVGVARTYHPASPPAIHPVPPLVACTMDDGMAVVFPGRSGTCARLGLPAASGQVKP